MAVAGCCDEPLEGAVSPGLPTGGGVATSACEDVSPYVCKQMQHVKLGSLEKASGWAT